MRHGIHAHNPTSQAGTRRERGDGSWCQRSTVRAEGLRLEEVGVLTRLGRPNKPSSMGERLGSIIPLEELPTGTPILDMRALSQIKVVRKFPGAGRAAHGLIPFGWCVPLLAYGRLIIRHLLSKRSQNFSVIFLDIGIRFPYTFFAPMVDFLPWKVSLTTGPDLPPDGSGLRCVSSSSPSHTATVRPFHTSSALAHP